MGPSDIKLCCILACKLAGINLMDWLEQTVSRAKLEGAQAEYSTGGDKDCYTRREHGEPWMHEPLAAAPQLAATGVARSPYSPRRRRPRCRRRPDAAHCQERPCPPPTLHLSGCGAVHP